MIEVYAEPRALPRDDDETFKYVHEWTVPMVELD